MIAGARIWIQGAGELASGVGWRLARCGYSVVMAEVAAPLAVRRLVCYGEAVRCGTLVIENIPGRLTSAAVPGWRDGEIAVIVAPDGEPMASWRPAVVIDARMTKRSPQPLPRADAPLVALGPGFRCGQDADLIVETHRGARLGAVIDAGTALADTGVPGAVGGVTVERVLRAPCAGYLVPERKIGDLVDAGDPIGTVGGQKLTAQVGGLVRGLIAPDVELFAGMKVGDIDPRGAAVDPRLISDKALAVAGGVLEALLRLGALPRRPEPEIDREGGNG